MDLRALRAADRVMGRVVNAIRTAIVQRIDDSKRVQELQTEALEDEVDDAVPHYQPLGVSFRPAVGAEVLLVSVGSDVANRIALAAQARGQRPTDAAEGAGGMYSPVDGEWKLYLAEDGTLHLGEKDASDYVALASRVDAEINRIWTTLTTWTVAPTDGGAALQAKAVVDSALVQPVGSENVKCS